MKQVFFIIGGPGSGKGTQCKLLEKKINFTHINVGEILRNERNKKNINSIIINRYIDNGLILPSHITVKLIIEEINKSHFDIILLDGFPRNIDNLKYWNNLKLNLNTNCILFSCDENILIKRLIKRSKNSNRKDDNLEIILKRIKIYNDNQEKLLKYLNETINYNTIDTSRNIYTINEELYQSVTKYISPN